MRGDGRVKKRDAEPGDGDGGEDFVHLLVRGLGKIIIVEHEQNQERE